VAAEVEAVVVVPLRRAEGHWSRRSLAERQVELRPVLPREPAVQKGWRQARPMTGLALKGRQDLTERVQSEPEAATPAPALATCSCILCSKAGRQEAEVRRRVRLSWT
jgi:hypothetical protein